MRANYVLSPAAQRDLDEIWDYTADNWSVDQADSYVLDLVAAVEAAASGRRNGRACDDIRPGYFKLPSGSHVIFYKKRVSKIDVIRILHQRMDFDRHF